MRETRFGSMVVRRTSPLGYIGKYEVLQFDRPGDEHTHARVEVAVCVYGTGVVMVDGTSYPVAPGAEVRIPARTPHHVVPIETPLCMVILYPRMNDANMD